MLSILLLLAGAFLGALLVFFVLQTRVQAARAQGDGLQARLQVADERSRQDAQTTENLRRDLTVAQSALADERVRASQAEAIGALVPKLEAQIADRERQIMEFNQESQRQAVAIQRLETTLHGERDGFQQKLQLLQDAKDALSHQFKTLATEILEEKTKRFTEQNKLNMTGLLDPLNEKIQTFGKLVQDTYDKDSKERLTLENELKRLADLNVRLGREALALTHALTGANNKTQGTWGEMVLEKVLEASGLTRDREYRVQVSDRVETGDGTKRYQPDVVIDLPDQKQLVVDSKVSLNAYVRFTQAEDEATRALELSAHIAAMRAHIRALSEKGYQNLYKLHTLDFVFLFVPVEPAYLLAVQHDMTLFSEAFERRIMIVGPSTLLATLRTVESIWRNERQNRNVDEIAKLGGVLHDKFVAFAETLEKVGKQLDLTRGSYSDAMKHLSEGRGNLVSKAETLRQLGVKASKRVPAHLLETETDEAAE